MNGLVKSVKHIQLKKIALTPKLYTALITYETHLDPSLKTTPLKTTPLKTTPFTPASHRRRRSRRGPLSVSDDIEEQKNLINKLIQENWFVSCENNKPDS